MWLLPLLVLILLLLLAFRPARVAVDIATVDAGPMWETIEEEAQTRVRERYRISAPLAARVPRTTLDPGDGVCMGEALIQLDPVPPSLLDARAHARAEAELGAAIAASERAATQAKSCALEEERLRRALERRRTLRATRTVSEEEFDTAQAAVACAEQDRRAAEQAYKMARYQQAQAEAVLKHARGEHSESFEVLSPIDGVVLRVFDENTRTVQPGEPLMELGDLSDLEIVIEVLSTDAIRIRPGQAVRVREWGGKALSATVRRVDPSAFTKISALGVDEQRVRIVADFEEGTDLSGFGDGFRLESDIVVWASEKVLRVPAGALFRIDGGWAAYNVVAGKCYRVPVVIGHHNGDIAEVREGLTVGDRVVLHPGDRVGEGARVRERRQ